MCNTQHIKPIFVNVLHSSLVPFVLPMLGIHGDYGIGPPWNILLGCFTLSLGI